MTTSKFVANDPFGGRDLLSNQNDPSHCIYMIFCKSQAPTYCGGQLVSCHVDDYLEKFGLTVALGSAICILDDIKLAYPNYDLKCKAKV